MLGHYLKVALRTLRRNPGYTAIHVLGLAVGVAACVLVFLYIRFETSYDEFHEEADRIVRVVRGSDASTRIGLGPAASSELPEVEAAVRIDDPIRPGRSGRRIEVRERAFYETGLYYVDSTFFDVFGYELRKGNPNEVLRRPFTVVITERIAEKYFGSDDPIGRTIRIPDRSREQSFEVTGVVEDPPPNSHLQYGLLASYATVPATETRSAKYPWRMVSVKTYLLLREPLERAGSSSFRRDVEALVARHTNGSTGESFAVQPITSIHLHSHLEGELAPPGNPTHLFIFGTLAGFLLLLASVNYVNLATARAGRRAGEIGIRKTAGGSRRQLILQFMGEAVLVSTGSGILAYGLVYLGLPVVSRVTGVEASVLLSAGGGSGLVALGALSVALFVGLVSGVYPALVLSRLEPSSVLRGKSIYAGSGAGLRKGLVALQFALSVAFVAATLIVWSQVDHMRTADLGIDEERVLVVDAHEGLGGNYEAFEQEAESHASIDALAGAVVGFPVTLPGTSTPWRPEGMSEEEFEARFEEGSISVHPFMVTEGFLEVLDISLIEGRSFAQSSAGPDTMHTLVNQTALEQFGWETAVGKELHGNMRETTLQVIGATEDFHYRALDVPVEPIVLWKFVGGPMSHVYVRFSGSNVSEVVETLRAQWEQFGDGTPFSYSFLDERFDRMYDAQERLATVSGAFAVIAILLAAMGLFGLASYSVSRRTKEISIRKVLGATTERVVALVSGDFLKLVGLGFLVAVPATVGVMHEWLENFAYRIELGPLHFLMAGGLVLAVALVAVGYQSTTAALLNPADTLRYE